MREIKLRAWDNIEKCFVYLTLSNGAYITPCLNISPDCKIMEPWQQYTGVKDKNGREIYEGDILVTSNSSDLYDIWDKKAFGNTIVEWDSFFDEWTGSNWIWEKDGNSVYDIKFVEVIGNIHENKDLLK